MSENNELDIRKALEKGMTRMTLKDLANKGFEKVKVLDENQVQDLIAQAVDRAVSTQTQEEREKILSDSRRELDRLMREHKAARSRAELLETNKNELIERVEGLQRQLQLKSELEEEALHKKFEEGTASLQAQVEDLRKRHQTAASEATGLRTSLEEARRDTARVKAQIPVLEAKAEEARELSARLEDLQSTHDAALTQLRAAQREGERLAEDRDRIEQEAEASVSRAEKLESSLADAQSKHRGAEKARGDLVAQILELQSRIEALQQEVNTYRGDAVKQRSEMTELRHELELARQTRDRAGQDQKKLEAEISRLGEALSQERSRQTELEAERSRLEAQTAETRARLESGEKSLRDSSSLLDRLQVDNASLEQEVRRLKAELQSMLARAEEERDALTDHVAELQAGHDRARQEAQKTGAERDRLHLDVVRLEHERNASQSELERLRTEETRERERAKEAVEASSALGSRLEEVESQLAVARQNLAESQTLHDEQEGRQARLEEELDQARQEAEKAGAERDRLHAEGGRLERERDASRSELERLGAEETKERERSAGALAASAALASKLSILEGELARAQESLAGSQKSQEELEGRRAQLEEELDAARQETAFLKGQLAQQQLDHEVQRDKTVIVTAELAEIEARQKEEQSEYDRLKAESNRLAREESRLQKELAEARSEVQALQDLLGREQESALGAQNETVALQSRLLDLQTRSGALEQDVATLRLENDRLSERLKAETDRTRAAEVQASATSALDEKLALLDRAIQAARSNSTTAKHSAAHSEEAAHTLDRALARQLRPKKGRRRASLEGGAAYDGMALLDSFFRKIRLKEHFQKFVPIREKVGPVHPSETLLEVLKADIGGDGRSGGKDRKVALEIVGPSDAPDAALLRQFLGRLSPQAVHAVGQVHDALRLHLNGLPKKPDALVFDVHAPDLALGGPSRARWRYRPLVCFEPGSEEFWNGRFRGSSEPDLEARLGFLKSTIAKVPSGFARSRVRFRMDSGFFNEAVIRLLESKGCSYVIAAPDSRARRKLARECPYNRLSNGWEVGEFQERLHPIRTTLGRFVAIRRRLGRVAREAGPGLFHDDRHVYHVFATDVRATPFRSFEFYQGRGAALGRASELMADFTSSPLLGRSRRSRAALFHLHLLASDLVRWFRRSCLPADQKDQGLDQLRSELFLVPPRAERPGTRSLVVLPKRDGRRRLFGRVTRRVRRIRPVRPFRLGR
jgi:chromosome segregation ATPase